MSVEATTDFRSHLVESRVLVPLGVDGLYARSGVFEGIVTALEDLVARTGADTGATRLRFPPFIPQWVFERTDYLRSFPDLAGSIHGFSGGDAEHAELLRLLDAGEDWTRALTASELTLCSAACHPLYPTLSGDLPTAMTFEVLGYCFRHEPSLDPARMQAFRQQEYVYVGDPDGAVAHRDRWVERGRDLLTSLGLDIEVVVANDPFFGRAGRILAAGQRQEVLKLELVCDVGADGYRVAISSGNCHRDHFGHNFDIRTPDGESAHTACIGFGLERITLALLWRHGFDPGTWPAGVRDRLWPSTDPRP